MRAAEIAPGVIGVIALLSAPAFAEEAVKVGGKAYVRSYTYDLGESGKKINNEFAIDRIYLTVDARLFDNARLKYVLEGGDLRDDSYSLGKGTPASLDNLALSSSKSYFDVATKVLLVEIGLPMSTYLQIGQIDLPWVGYVDGLWGYRVEGTNFLDRSGYLTSTDLGVAWGGKMNLASWQINIANGEGWKAPEAGYHKDFHGRLTLYPLAPFGSKEFFVSGAGTLGTYDPDVFLATPTQFNRTRYIGQVGYHSKGNLLLAADYLFQAQDPASKMSGRYKSLTDPSLKDKLASGTGYSVYGVLNLGMFGTLEALKPIDLIGRFDSLDPDTTLANNGMTRVIGGVAVNWHRSFTTLLAYDSASYEVGFEDASNADAQKAKKPDQKVMLTSEVRF